MKPIPASSTITVQSNRIYLDELSADNCRAIQSTRDAYCMALGELYNCKYNHTFLNKPCANDTAYIKAWLYSVLGVTPMEYYITSLQAQASGMISSQKELLKLRETEYQARVEIRDKKLKSLQEDLDLYLKVKGKLIERSRKLAEKKKPPKKLPAAYVPNKKAFQKQLPVADRRNGEKIYAYELWIDGKIKWLKATIAQIKEKARVDESRQTGIPSRITFGGKAFYRSKDTTDIPMEEWHRLRNEKRSGMILFSGKYDTAWKNHLLKYNHKTHEMHMVAIDRNEIVLKDVVFPYRFDDLLSVLSHKNEQGCSVGYWMDFRKDHKGREYFLIKASFTLREDEKHSMNYCISDGVISVDLNLDNISWSELDSMGRRMRGDEIRFDLMGKSSGQNDDILGRACNQIIRLCENTNKPLAMEDLDLTKKAASLAYGHKKANLGTRMFAYSKMTAFLEGGAFKRNVGVIKVNPAYTSFIGKIKYMRRLRCPIHGAASYCIGRRAMGFKEKMPKYLAGIMTNDRLRKHRWSQANYLNSVTKEIPIFIFKRKLPAFSCVGDLASYKYSNLR